MILTLVSEIHPMTKELSIQSSAVIKAIGMFPDISQKLSDVDCKVETIGENLQSESFERILILNT